LREVIGVAVHVVPRRGLARASVAAPVVRDDAVALLRQEEHLTVPRVRVQWPAVGEGDGWSGAPILVVDLRTVVSCDGAHESAPCNWFKCKGIMGSSSVSSRQYRTPVVAPVGATGGSPKGRG